MPSARTCIVLEVAERPLPGASGLRHGEPLAARPWAIGRADLQRHDVDAIQRLNAPASVRRLRPFLVNIYRHGHLIHAMAQREVKTRYVGTIGGALWAILQPLALVTTFWLVFSVGFRAQGPNDTPFLLYFLCALIPWLTFNEVLNSSTNAVTGNAHLVKKIVFPSEVLPLVYLEAATMTHAVMVVVLMIVTSLSGFGPFLYALQLLYYFIAMSTLLLGLSWLLSSLNVFYRDVAQIVSVVLNLWFWLTPIVWTTDMMPERYRWIASLNPVYYIIEGYRSSLLYAEPFWADARTGIYYWLVALALFSVGSYTFRRLKPEFADML